LVALVVLALAGLAGLAREAAATVGKPGQRVRDALQEKEKDHLLDVLHEQYGQ
jgi:hypothetical protein